MLAALGGKKAEDVLVVDIGQAWEHDDATQESTRPQIDGVVVYY